jgi:hypothetical protein
MYKSCLRCLGSTLAIALLLVGCGKVDGTRITGPPLGGRTQLTPVSNLQAYSAGATSVGLKWTPSPSEDLPDFNNYYIRAKLGTDSIVSTATAAAGDSSVVVDGLTEGVIYVFEVTTAANLNSTKYWNSVPRIIRWSPATRFESLPGGAPIKVFETSDSSGIHSGLIFCDSATHAPKVVSTTSPGADSLAIDLYVLPNGTKNVYIKSASVLHPTWRHTKFSSSGALPASSLDAPRYTNPDSSMFTWTSIIISSSTTASSVIYYFKTVTGNYGRLLLQRNPANRSLIWGTSPALYLNVQISYQSVSNVLFAKTAASGGSAGR